MMKEYTFRYGDGTVKIPLDERGVLGELHGNRVPPIGDIPAALDAALNAPVDAPALKDWLSPNDRVCLIISDMSRFWMRQDRVIPPLVDYLNRAGIPDVQITILVANGTHIGGDERELRTLTTDAIYDRIRIVNHDCLADDLVEIGVTSLGTPVRINWMKAAAIPI